MPVLITASTEEVGMGLVPEDRASARSDEPEARSAARWRGRAAEDTPARLARALAGARACPLAVRWLVLQRDLGRSPRTVDAYARSLVDYLRYCERRERRRRGRPDGRRSRATFVICGSGRAVTARTWSRSTRAPGWRTRRCSCGSRSFGCSTTSSSRSEYGIATRSGGVIAPRDGRAGGGVWSRGLSRCRGSRPMRSGGRCSRSQPGSRCGTG